MENTGRNKKCCKGFINRAIMWPVLTDLCLTLREKVLARVVAFGLYCGAMKKERETPRRQSKARKPVPMSAKTLLYGHGHIRRRGEPGRASRQETFAR